MSADTDNNKRAGAAAARPRNLGRGLAALFGEEAAKAEAPAPAEAVRGKETKTLPIEYLRPGRFQPRRHFDPAQIQSLVDSVREKGILQPILVRRLDGEANAYEIVAGERRWRAAQAAQLHEVPVAIRELSDRDALEIALVENVQRENLNAMEEAEGYQRLIDEFKHTQDELARALGKSRSHIANTLRLLVLPFAVREMIESGQLSAGHGRALIGAPDAEAIARDAVEQGLSVRQVEELVKSGRQRGGKIVPKKKIVARDPNIVALERDLANRLGLKVAISFDGKNRGALTISYNTLDQLDGVLKRLGK